MAALTLFRRAVPGVAILALCALTLGLARQNRQMRGTLALLRTRVVEPYPGFPVPPMRLATLSGDSVAIGAEDGSGHTLLIAFTVTCPYCEASVPAWRTIAARLERDSSAIDVLGIGMSPRDSLAEYARRHALPFPIAIPTRRMPLLYRARRVPLIALIAPDGYVAYARLGEVTDPAPVIDSVLAALQPVAPVQVGDSGIARSPTTAVP